MQFRLLIGTIFILFIVALIKKPFKNRGRFKELINHLIVSLGTYYGMYIMLSTFGLEQNKSMAVAVGITAAVLLILNIFFRKV